MKSFIVYVQFDKSSNKLYFPAKSLNQINRMKRQNKEIIISEYKIFVQSKRITQLHINYRNLKIRKQIIWTSIVK